MVIKSYIWFQAPEEKKKLADIIKSNDKPIAIQNIAMEFKMDRSDAMKAYIAFTERMQKGGQDE